MDNAREGVEKQEMRTYDLMSGSSPTPYQSTDKQTDRQADNRMDGRTDGRADRETRKLTDRQTDRQTVPPA